MELGAFSISLAVKDLEASRTFYEKFGFTVFDTAKLMLVTTLLNTLLARRLGGKDQAEELLIRSRQRAHQIDVLALHVAGEADIGFLVGKAPGLQRAQLRRRARRKRLRHRLVTGHGQIHAHWVSSLDLEHVRIGRGVLQRVV